MDLKRKVGELVQIRSEEWYRNFLRNSRGSDMVNFKTESCSGAVSFDRFHARFCGLVARITEVGTYNKSFYTLDIDNGLSSWIDEMFEEETDQIELEKIREKLEFGNKKYKEAYEIADARNSYMKRVEELVSKYINKVKVEYSDYENLTLQINRKSHNILINTNIYAETGAPEDIKLTVYCELMIGSMFFNLLANNEFIKQLKGVIAEFYPVLSKDIQ